MYARKPQGERKMSFQKKSLITNHTVVKKAILAKSVGVPTSSGSISAPKINMKAAMATTKQATKVAMKASTKQATRAAMKASLKSTTRAATKASLKASTKQALRAAF
jgi:hypothetical protein